MGTKEDKQHPEEGQTLASINKEEGFATPASYFDELPSEIMDRIHQGANDQKPAFNLKPVLAFSSLLILSGIVTLFLLFKNEHLPAEPVLSEFEIEHVLENPDLYNISRDAVTEKYLSMNIPEGDIAEDIALPEEDIRSYLEEDPELTDIINEY